MPPEKQIQSDSSSYDFILNAGDPPKESLWSKIDKKRVIIFVIFVIIFIIICSIVFTIISNKNNLTQQSRLLTVAQSQNEVIRTSELGYERITDPDLKKRVQNIDTTLKKAVENTKIMIYDRGDNVEESQLTANQDNGTEDLLNKAETYGNYDETLDKVLNTKLTAYQQALLIAEKSSNKAEKSALEANYKEADAMLGLVDHL